MMNDDESYQNIARKIIPYVNNLSGMYSEVQKQGMYDDDLEIVGSTAATLKAFKKYKSRFYNDDDLVNYDENKEGDYIRFLEYELENLLMIVYHVHKSDFDKFVDVASKLETDDIISFMMN